MKSGNISHLESLPLDVFRHMVDVGEINNEDLLRLCNSSPILNKYCNKDEQLIFKTALKRTFNVTDTRGYKPRYFLKLFKFSIQNSYGYQPGKVQLLIPDLIIEKFLIKLNKDLNKNIIIDELKKSKMFKEIIEQHHMGLNKNGELIIHPGEDRQSFLEWKINEYIIVEDDIIPIIQISEPKLQSIDPWNNPYGPKDGHGNFFVTIDGYIKEHKDKYGRVINKIYQSSGNRYPTKAAAEPEAKYNIDRLYDMYNSRKKIGQDFVILGIIIFTDQLQKLYEEFS